MTDLLENRWLLLIHQLPPKPNYFRVKVWRRLQRLGAVAIKNSVYVLPKTEQTQEDFQWLLREIVEGGGDATLCEALFLEGISDDQVVSVFQSARDADYAQLAEEARSLVEAAPGADDLSSEVLSELASDLKRLRRRLDETVAIDYFGAPGRETAERLLRRLEERLVPAGTGTPNPAPDLCGRTWVTRQGIKIDRMASAWLIRRFIDPRATFKFVPPQGYLPLPEEVRFDMYEAEFTHEGDGCTFEVLIRRFGLSEPALGPLAEIIHDIDLKDQKYGRPEAPGIAALVTALAMAHPDDEDRMSRSSEILDDLYAYFGRATHDHASTLVG